MPSSFVSKSEEPKWEEAKKLAAEEGQKNNYAYITSIFKKLTGKEQTNGYISIYREALNNIHVEFQITDFSSKNLYKVPVKSGSKFKVVPLKYASDFKKKYSRYVRNLLANKWTKPEGDLICTFDLPFDKAKEFIENTGLDNSMEINIEGKYPNNLIASRFSLKYEGKEYSPDEFYNLVLTNV